MRNDNLIIFCIAGERWQDLEAENAAQCSTKLNYFSTERPGILRIFVDVTDK